ncbi:MAG: TrmH family RNA methyltransferase [Leptolyngbya sp. IPPAS B-1204]|nr:RNA methyltransferase [Elainella sp. C42_A2020_010]RNJ66970.1 MAG: TrmH family RNA methyltransferase [Leptolyngbya sp. IPPAS B-1204]
MFQRPNSRESYRALPRHPLIVCATLVQNPANLGGLCRTVESFRLQSLVLADLATIRSPVFKNLAASSHHWQPLQACPPADLPQWLGQQQANYPIVALTAEPTAIPLPKFVFPQQAVLLLGQELTGIPAALLDQCDYAVTIPQFGLVESLNVQTAAAIAIYEYVRQRIG